jgi:hypothetical protein
MSHAGFRRFAKAGMVSGLIQLLTLLAVPSTVLLYIRQLNRRDDQAELIIAASSR